MRESRHLLSSKQTEFVYKVLTEIHKWGLTTDLENHYRRCLRNVYESESYSERDKFTLQLVREEYVKRKRREYKST